MGSERWNRKAFGGTGKIFQTVAAASIIIMLLIGTSRAGDISGQPADSLRVTNSVTNLLPQAPATPPPAPAAGPPPPGEEQSWLSGLRISGYASQTFGMWQNPTNLKAYTRSRNNLAVARSLLQVDENYRLNENNTFFMREWFVYEPPYSFNSAGNPFWSAGTRVAGATPGRPSANPFCVSADCLRTAPNGNSFGHFMNGFYNNYQVRDAWWENKTGPLTTFIGNQLVVWGQSLAFRVGDVINPADTCWAFGFANLEQSREAQWMVHPILSLPEWGPFTSNFLELVVQPGFQPRWWPEQSDDPFQKYKNNLKAGRVQPCLPAGSHGPSAKFDVQYSTEPRFGADYITSALGSHSTFGAQLPGPCVTSGPCVAGNMVDPPASRLFFLCAPLTSTVAKGWNPYAANLKKFPGGFPCNLGLNKHEGDSSEDGDGTLVDFGFWHIPGMQPHYWNEGVRFHTLYGATEWTALYYNDNVSSGAPWTIKWTPFTNLYNYSFYPIQEAAVTVDRPLPAPASIAEYFPAVFRGEVLYQNHVSFNDMRFSNMTGQAWSDVVKYMLAIDLDQAYAPWLTSTGNLSANLEVLHSIVMDNAKTFYLGNDLNSHQLKNDVSVLFNIGTSWWWSDFAPTWTMIWNPKGDNFALFPSIILNPPWTKKYFMKLQAIEILGGDKEWGTGLFKGQNYLIAQFQYNFNVM
jgi:hypothetical protein